VRVERMDDEVEELAYFRLELLFRHGNVDYCQKRARRKDGRVNLAGTEVMMSLGSCLAVPTPPAGWRIASSAMRP
jgi:hypothetical protein